MKHSEKGDIQNLVLTPLAISFRGLCLLEVCFHKKDDQKVITC